MAPLERATHLYRVTFSLLIAYSSAATFLAAWQGTDGHLPRSALLALSGLEALAALGFLMRRGRVFGVLLALVFMVAVLIHLWHSGTLPGALLVYLATTLYLLRATRPDSAGAAWA